jgi:putative DNA primase/helicase
VQRRGIRDRQQGPRFLLRGVRDRAEVRAALSALKMRYRVHVCFSAHNLAKLAGACEGGLVIADNDLSGAGLRAAELCGRRWIMSDMQGEDANDWHRRLGTFRFAQELRKELAKI